MIEENQLSRIHAELATLKTKEVSLDNSYRHMYHSGMATFDLLQGLERIRKRRVELETALKIFEEFK